ncbi:MAG: ribonuclease J, partial [Caulobacteraceae bacterium]
AGSELDVRERLGALIAPLKGKVAAACFASNVARMETIARAAEAAGRRVCLVGRSMIRMSQAARSVGLLVGLAPFVSEDEAKDLSPSEILYLCTGSQGEPRAALARIAEGGHPRVRLDAGDACIFSSRIIPGNEVAIRNLQNRLADRGVRLFTERDHPGIHVSGHPCRGELARMYQWARPQIAVPTHGERRHLIEHAAYARDLQVPEAIAPRNGEMVRLAPQGPEIVDEVPAGRLYVDGGMVTSEAGEALRERRHLAANGVIGVSLAIDRRGDIAAGPRLWAAGLPSAEDQPIDKVMEDFAKDARRALASMSTEDRLDPQLVESAVARTLKKSAFRVWKRRPAVEAQVLFV